MQPHGNAAARRSAAGRAAEEAEQLDGVARGAAERRHGRREHAFPGRGRALVHRDGVGHGIDRIEAVDAEQLRERGRRVGVARAQRPAAEFGDAEAVD